MENEKKQSIKLKIKDEIIISGVVIIGRSPAYELVKHGKELTLIDNNGWPTL